MEEKAEREKEKIGKNAEWLAFREKFGSVYSFTHFWPLKRFIREAFIAGKIWVKLREVFQN